jgi:hypothetical protein
MTIPGFTAEASAYESTRQYRGFALDGAHEASGVSPASTHADEAAIGPIDPCRRCARMFGCTKSRCLCQCDGGIPLANSHAHCGFLCT